MVHYYVWMLDALILFAFVIQEQRLKIIEEEVLEQLVKQIKLHSENIISDLESSTAQLKTEPEDLNDFSKYALLVFKLSYLHKDNVVKDENLIYW